MQESNRTVTGCSGKLIESSSSEAKTSAELQRKREEHYSNAAGKGDKLTMLLCVGGKNCPGYERGTEQGEKSEIGKHYLLSPCTCSHLKPLGNLCKPRRQRQRRQTKGLMNRTIERLSMTLAANGKRQK